MRVQTGKRALACATAAVLFGVGYVSVGYSAPAGPTDTTPPPETTPAPDPAPPLPKPKPATNPPPVYHPPVHHSTPAPAPQPTYTPPPVVHHVVTKPVPPRRRHKPRHKRTASAAATPKPVGAVKHASVVHVAPAVPVIAAAVTTDASDALQRSLVITGTGLAALLFLLVVTAPSTVARRTPAGRVVLDHQLDLLLAGVALLLLAALLFTITEVV
jgi:hypothetical protein